MTTETEAPRTAQQLSERLLDEIVKRGATATWRLEARAMLREAVEQARAEGRQEAVRLREALERLLDGISSYHVRVGDGPWRHGTNVDTSPLCDCDERKAGARAILDRAAGLDASVSHRHERDDHIGGYCLLGDASESPPPTADEVWSRLESEPGFNEEMRQAERDIAEGRGTPFREVVGDASESPPPEYGWHNDGDECIGPHCINMEHDDERDASESGQPPEASDE